MARPAQWLYSMTNDSWVNNLVQLNLTRGLLVSIVYGLKRLRLNDFPKSEKQEKKIEK